MLQRRDVDFVMHAHTEKALSPDKAVRKWDGETPYFSHPLWCATTLLTESNLPMRIRKDGAQALLYHDVLEDTNEGLPDWLRPNVVQLVQDMTFEDNSHEMVCVWDKPPVVRLLKLYDKVSNMLDSSWMDDEKRDRYRDYIRRLCEDVEVYYGKDLNILRLAYAIIS